LVYINYIVDLHSGVKEGGRLLPKRLLPGQKPGADPQYLRGSAAEYFTVGRKNNN